MAGPLNRFSRVAGPPPAIGRCPVCRGDIRGGDELLSFRGGLRVHRGCATYRMRQRSRRA